MIHQAKSRTLLTRLLGVFIFLPSLSYAILIFVAALIFSGSAARPKVNVSSLTLPILFGITLISCMPGMLIGNDEAFQYLQRALVCAVASMSALCIFRRGDTVLLQIFLYWLCVAALVNAAFVIVTALSPDLYDTLRLREFSGFDKHMRPLRSPGLFRGFDTSGYFMIFALCALPVSSWSQKNGKIATFTAIVLLSAACVLSSRSTIILLGFSFIFSAILYGRSVSRLYRSLAFLGIAPAGFIGFLFLSMFFGIDSKYDLNSIFFMLIDEEANAVYSQSSDDYLSHFRFSDVGLFPSYSSETPDNFYARAGIALGWLGVLGVISPILFAAAASILSHQGELRAFSVIFTILFLLSNFKNNYFLFLPFLMVLIILFASRPRPT